MTLTCGTGQLSLCITLTAVLTTTTMVRQRTVDAPLPLFRQRPIPVSITHLTADLTELIYSSENSLQRTAKHLNLMSDNSKILMIRHLRRVVPRLEALLFNRKKLHQLNR